MRRTARYESNQVAGSMGLCESLKSSIEVEGGSVYRDDLCLPSLCERRGLWWGDHGIFSVVVSG